MESNLLQHRHVFGYNPQVRNGLHFAEDRQVLYPAGQTCVLTHTEKKQQTFFQGTEKWNGISCMALSPNQRYLAVAENQSPNISIFDVLTTRKLTTCAVPSTSSSGSSSSNPGPKEYVSLAFSPENQFLLTQGGSSNSSGGLSGNNASGGGNNASVGKQSSSGGQGAISGGGTASHTVVGAPNDCALLYWNWDKNRVMAACKVQRSSGDLVPVTELVSSGTGDGTETAGNPDEPVPPTSHDPTHQVAFHPADSSVSLIVGKSICKLLRYGEGGFSVAASLPQAKGENFLSHCWLADERLVVAAESGQVYLMSATELELEHILEEKFDKCADFHFARFSKGFLASSTDARVCFFYSEEGTFLKKAEVAIPNQETAIGGLNIDGSNITCKGLAMSSSGNEDSFVFGTSSGQIYKVVLPAGLEKPQNLENAGLTPVPLLAGFHVGPVNGMDVCVRKPLIVTAGADRTVRVWNYQDRSAELCKSFAEEPFAVAIHPNGFLVIVGFSDKLRLLNLIMEDLKPSKDIPIKGCREVRFSNGGHYFAATNNNLTQVFKTYTGELVYTLRGHNNKARAVSWSLDDSGLVSCGMDGGVYEFDMLQDAHRKSDWVQKGVAFTGLSVATDPYTLGNTMYISGSDRQLREVYNCSMQQCFETGDSCLNSLALANGMKALLAGADSGQGFVRCYRFPLEALDCTDYAAHCAPVSRIRVSLDDQFVFTCGEDGCVFVFDLRKQNLVSLPIAGCNLAKEAVKKREHGTATAIKLETYNDRSLLPYSDEILVTKTFLDEKQGQLVELERQVDELSNQIEFQLRHRDLYHKEKIAELEDRFGQEIEQERAKYELLREEKNDMEMECEENIRAIEEKHAKQIQDIEASFQQKMMVEVGRYQKLSATRDREHQDWESSYKEILAKHTREIDDNARKFQEQRGEGEAQQSRILAEKDLSDRIHRETLNQLEQDADREVEELKEQYEERLTAERDDKVRLRGQAGIHRKHHEDLKRQMLKKEEEFRFFSEEARKKQEKIDASILEREQNMKEIKDRDRTIGDKETKIYELKKQNAELEKFKFVLDYKIKELRAQIEPKNADIAQMKRIIQTMDSDLEEYHRKNKTLQTDIGNLQSKQQSLQEEILLQRKKVADAMTKSKKIKHDLFELSDMMNNVSVKEFREKFLKLSDKYLNAHLATSPKSSPQSKNNATVKSNPAATTTTNSSMNQTKSSAMSAEEIQEQIQITNEYAKQKEYLQKSVQSLTKKLHKDSETHKKDNQTAMQDNMRLIQTIDSLRKEITQLKLDAAPVIGQDKK